MENGSGAPGAASRRAPARAEDRRRGDADRRRDPGRRTTALRHLIDRPELSFILEAHNGLSARIAEEAGFEGIWASGLSISASLGVRDSNEASWTQVLEVLEFMADATTVPILVDGDTGYGNFNNMRRLVRKLEQRGIAGVCIEDKLFPKTNSFIRGTTQPLADIGEFAGRIRAGKDAQADDDFVIVARVEAFIAGWGLEEALRRAEAYHSAGADAILMHSAKRSAEEVLAFKREWGDRCPVVIVPTKYYGTPTSVFEDAGISLVIWANHLMRSSVACMQETADQIARDRSLVHVEDRIAPVSEVFRLQGADELAEAEQRYLPQGTRTTRAIILGGARGPEFGVLTADRPKCMVEVDGRPILARVVKSYRRAGIRDITVVRGWKKEAVDLPGLSYADNDRPEETDEVFSLSRALSAFEEGGPFLVSYGDVLFRKYIPQQLLDVPADFAIMVDAQWKTSRNRNRFADYVACSEPYSRWTGYESVTLEEVGADLPRDRIHGEWMGFLKVSKEGAPRLVEILREVSEDEERAASMTMGDLLNELVRRGNEIRVIYTTGNWLDVDAVEDALDSRDFQ